MPSSDIESDDYQPKVGDLITLPEAAAFSGLSHSHLRKLVRTEEIWGKRFGQTWVTTKKAVKKYLAREHRPGPKSQRNI